MADEPLYDQSQKNNNSNQKPTKNKKQQSNSEVEARIKISPLTLTIFKRQTENGTFRNMQLQRAYTKDDGENFDYTNQLRPRDLRKASRLLEKAADQLQGLKTETEN